MFAVTEEEGAAIRAVTWRCRRQAMVPGVRGNALMDGAASAGRLVANDLPSGGKSRGDQGNLAA
jgi:hypothetical protein